MYVGDGDRSNNEIYLLYTIRAFRLTEIFTSLFLECISKAAFVGLFQSRFIIIRHFKDLP